MSLFLHQYNQSQIRNKFYKTELSFEEEISTIKNTWIGGNSDINNIIKMFQQKNYQVKVLSEEHVMTYSLNEVKNKSICLFSSDRPMKSFILSAIDYFNRENSQYPIASWQAQFDGTDKLVLVNFGKVPSGNYIFNKYVYTFNYFELKITK